MIKKTVIYNIPLHTDNVWDYPKLNRMFNAFANDFKDVVRFIYDGSCTIQATIGCYKFEYPNLIRKQLLPQLHIIASGRNSENIDVLIEKYLNCSFNLISYGKLYIDKNPFSRHNDKLFSTISYRKIKLKIHNKKKRLFTSHCLKRNVNLFS